MEKDSITGALHHNHMTSKLKWKKYEEEIANHFRTAYPSAVVRHNVRLMGSHSKKLRQIDVLIETGSAEFPIRIVVEGRNKGRKLDVTAVDAFLTLLKDVQAHVGVMVCPLGYTAAALNQARNNDQDVYLEVLNLAELMA
jgi:Restriction endonuclease